MFLDGQTPSSIASFLTKQRVPAPAGKEKWQSSTVKSILTNEKYKGDALLQKTFTVDFLSKKAKLNEGEVPQYYVEKSHPAIVSTEVFDLAQYEMKRRAKKGRHTSAASIFSDKLVCGECGAVYGSKVWHSTDAYRTMIWRCNEKYAVKGQPCPSPHLREEEIQNAFVQAVNQAIERKDEVLSTLQEALTTLTDSDGLEREIERLQAEQEVVSQQMSRMIREILLGTAQYPLFHLLFLPDFYFPAGIFLYYAFVQCGLHGGGKQPKYPLNCANGQPGSTHVLCELVCQSRCKLRQIQTAQYWKNMFVYLYQIRLIR